MGTFKPEKIAETPSDQGSGYFSRSKFGLVPRSYLKSSALRALNG
jgi:hypothetical protein